MGDALKAPFKLFLLSILPGIVFFKIGFAQAPDRATHPQNSANYHIESSSENLDFLQPQESLAKVIAEVDTYCVKQTRALAKRAYILFPFNSAALDSNYFAFLDSLASAMNNCRQSILVITGYSDSLGTNVFNENLSAKRARIVFDYFVAKGVPKGRMELRAMGEMDPEIYKENYRDIYLSRRVDLYVTQHEPSRLTGYKSF